MPAAPLAKGIIIAASVVLAASIALYESPHVREFVTSSRRRLAHALHAVADEVQPRSAPRSSSGSDDDKAATADEKKKGDDEDKEREREERLRQRRNEIVARARAEGVAVDLDELARVGAEEAEAGKEQGKTSGVEEKGSARHRGAASTAAGAAAGAITVVGAAATSELFFSAPTDEQEEEQQQQRQQADASRESSTTLAPASPTGTADFDLSVAGTLTPRSSISHSHHGSDASMLADFEAFSDAFSEGGYSEFTAPGAMTPASWTDVGSDDGWGEGGVGLS